MNGSKIKEAVIQNKYVTLMDVKTLLYLIFILFKLLFKLLVFSITFIYKYILYIYYIYVIYTFTCFIFYTYLYLHIFSCQIFYFFTYLLIFLFTYLYFLESSNYYSLIGVIMKAFFYFVCNVQVYGCIKQIEDSYSDSRQDGGFFLQESFHEK